MITRTHTLSTNELGRVRGYAGAREHVRACSMCVCVCVCVYWMDASARGPVDDAINGIHEGHEESIEPHF